MKFLLDVCVSTRSLTEFLVKNGHDVRSALEAYPRAGDDQLLELALCEGRILITEDKDFGELVFVQRRTHGPIVRVVELSVRQQVEGIRELLDRYSQELRRPVMVTITPGRIRIRHPHD